MTPGHKQTNLGNIPMAWDIARIDQLASITTGSRNTQDRVEEGSYPFFVRSQKVERINSYSYDGEAVLTVGDGVGTGKVFHYIHGKFDVHQRVYRISKFSNRLDGRYFFYQFSNRFYRRSMSMTAKSSVDSIRLEMIAGMEVPVPPLAEQRAIAEALGDVDALLDGLNQLIAKKRDLRQAAMQQLLTGQTRLPGFSESWVTVQLGDISQIKTGDRNHEDKEDGGRYPFFVRSKVVESIDSFSYDCEAIIVPGEGNIGSILHYVSGRFDLHQRVYKVSEFPEWIHGRFIYFSMAHGFGSHAMRNTVKATVDSLRLPTFLNFKLAVPSTIREQRAIATVLSDMDAEIAALEARRDKMRDLQQAMMQELLTGKTRLIEPELAHA